MSEEKKENPNPEHDPTKIEIDKEQIIHAPKNFWNFLRNTLSFSDEVDMEETTKTIKANISFSGANVWVLMCSIIVACIGLNSNSTAVIIGAMLISPLMGPIRGVGLGFGTNDFATIIKSLKNFGVMVAVSFLVAWIYFMVTPIKAVTPELDARVHPQAMDVLIGFFGGLAGIIAGATGDRSTVVPGVAIATALMPPMCTAAFGIAIGDFSYFWGALYLFLLNSVFICLSTIIVIRYLGFPLKEFVNPKIERRVKIYSALALILIIVPSVLMFITLVKENVYSETIKEFEKKELSYYPNIEIDSYEWRPDSSILVLKNSGPIISAEEIDIWKSKLKEEGVKRIGLEILGNEPSPTGEINGISEEVFYDQHKSYQELKKNNQILVEELSHLKRREINAQKLSNLVKIDYQELVDSIRCGSVQTTNLNQTTDTTALYVVYWNDSLSAQVFEEKKKKLEAHLKLNFDQASTAFIHQYNGK